MKIKKMIVLSLLLGMIFTTLFSKPNLIVNAMTEPVKLTSGITHVQVKEDQFVTYVDRDKLPESAKNFTRIRVMSSDRPFDQIGYSIEDFMYGGDVYDEQRGYGSGIHKGDRIIYTFVTLYGEDRWALAYTDSVTIHMKTNTEEGSSVPSTSPTPSTSPVPTNSPNPTKNTNGYGSDIDPSYNQQPSQLFSDVAPNFWAYDAITSLANQNVIAGYPDGQFRPNKIVTRAEFAKMMVSAASLEPKRVNTVSFADIKPSDWYTPFIESAKYYLNGYRNSKGETVYRPQASALREDIAIAVVKLKGYDQTRFPDLSIVDAMFSDSHTISNYAKTYVALAVENQLMSGFPDNTFKPQKALTRAEAAAILYRVFQHGNDDKLGFDDEYTPIIPEFEEPQSIPVLEDSTGEMIEEPTVEPTEELREEPTAEPSVEPEVIVNDSSKEDILPIDEEDNTPSGVDGSEGI